MSYGSAIAVLGDSVPLGKVNAQACTEAAAYSFDG